MWIINLHTKDRHLFTLQPMVKTRHMFQVDQLDVIIWDKQEGMKSPGNKVVRESNEKQANFYFSYHLTST